ncbi:MAG: ChrR family anti-sigma-E factor [Pseudomonadota bacterium]
MAILHHPDDATLMSFAAGSLPEALAAVVATHLAMCQSCTQDVAEMELLGSVFLSHEAPAHMERGVSRAKFHAAEADMDDEVMTRPCASSDSCSEIPGPLARVLGDNLDDIHWKRLGFGVWHHPIPLSGANSGDLRLLKVAPGRVMPEHGHGGSELTLLLRGSYTDEVGVFSVGDLADLDDEIDHSPIADPVHGCICLIASEEKAKFKSIFARMVQPLTGI